MVDLFVMQHIEWGNFAAARKKENNKDLKQYFNYTPDCIDKFQWGVIWSLENTLKEYVKLKIAIFAKFPLSMNYHKMFYFKVIYQQIK